MTKNIHIANFKAKNRAIGAEKDMSILRIKKEPEKFRLLKSYILWLIIKLILV